MNSPAGRNLAIVATGALVALVLVVVGLTSGGGGGEHGDAEPSARAPAPVIVRDADGDSPSRELSAAERGAARRAAVAFARSYLPVLYGQAKPRRVAHATTYVRRSLRDTRRPPRAVRRRHPRLERLELIGQTSRSMLARARVRDGVAPPFAVIFTIERRDRGWVVSGLAND